MARRIFFFFFIGNAWRLTGEKLAQVSRGQGVFAKDTSTEDEPLLDHFFMFSCAKYQGTYTS